MTKWTRDHTRTKVLGHTFLGALTRTQLKEKHALLSKRQDFCVFNSFISKNKLKTVKFVLVHVYWVKAMQDELHEFERNKVWRLILTPPNASAIGLKWVFQKNWIKKEIS